MSCSNVLRMMTLFLVLNSVCFSLGKQLGTIDETIRLSNVIHSRLYLKLILLSRLLCYCSL